MTKKATKMIWLCCGILWFVMAVIKITEKDNMQALLNVVVGLLCIVNFFITRVSDVNPENEIIGIVDDEDEEAETLDKAIETAKYESKIEEEDTNEEK